MNIQRDVDPENDKKLDKMLDAKFGKRDRTISTGDDVRKAKLIIKSLEVIKAALEKQRPRRRPTTVFDVSSPSQRTMGRVVGRRAARALESGGRAAMRGMARRGLTGTGGRKDPVGGRVGPVRVGRRIHPSTRGQATTRKPVPAHRRISARRREGAYASRVRDPSVTRAGSNIPSAIRTSRRLTHEAARHGLLGSGGRGKPVGGKIKPSTRRLRPLRKNPTVFSVEKQQRRRQGPAGLWTQRVREAGRRAASPAAVETRRVSQAARMRRAHTPVAIARRGRQITRWGARHGLFGTGGAKDPVKVPKNLLNIARRRANAIKQK